METYPNMTMTEIMLRIFIHTRSLAKKACNVRPRRGEDIFFEEGRVLHRRESSALLHIDYMYIVLWTCKKANDLKNVRTIRK